ncbi:uncharacterized protein SCHCODRAFT_01343527 [Schizophyllum commune H4-8]|uniref:Uncharacterized protein n=1 Tax=Schizophyllum commune (strain H4-8 / FGSC 9210) TaxID=578458 RepID=D8QLD2_SCHCM|nr:uncharacterized protein SCHCODRAFT_01343527 [Schizophyllum commune H4-8]KAI5884855.1 hypothetical protein SCHCODRAFT_01343527 [Schizophyllum commune H4-8]
MDNVFWNGYDASNNAFTRMEAQTKENAPEGNTTLPRRSSASNTDAQHGEGKMALSLQASPGRAQPGRRALSRSANSLFFLNDLQGLQREPSFENIGVAPVDTWNLGIPVETSLSDLSSSEDDEDEDDDDEPVAPPPPPPSRARGGRRRASAPRRMAGGRKARVQEDAEDSEDDAGATAKPPIRTARSSGRTRGSATTRGRASTRGRATSTRGRASTARAQTRTRTGPARSAAVQTPIDDVATSNSESLEELERRLRAETIVILRRKQEEEAARRANAEDHARADSGDDSDTDTESVASAVSEVGSIAPAVQLWRPIADDVADFTPSPSRTPPATASAPEPAPLPSATPEPAATSPRQTSIEGEERAIEAQPEVEDSANTPASPAPAHPNHVPREESAQQAVTAPMSSMPANLSARHSSPAPAQNPPRALVQNPPPAPAHFAPPNPAPVQPAAPVPWFSQAAPMAYAPTPYTNTPMDGMPAVPHAHEHRQPHIHSHYRLPAPSYHPQPAPMHYRQHAAPAQSSYGAVPPQATVEAQPMDSTMFPAPPLVMLAPPMQSQPLVQAPVVSHGSVRANKRPWSSTQEPWAANYTSAAAPAPAHAQGTMGAHAGSSTQSSSGSVSSGVSSSRIGAQRPTHTNSNGTARNIAPLPFWPPASSAMLGPANYTGAYGAPVGRKYKRILYASDQVPTVVAVLLMLQEVINGDAVFSEELYQMIYHHHPDYREHLEKAVALARKPDTSAPPPPPRKCEGVKDTTEPVAPGAHRHECRWDHQGHPGKWCGWEFEIDYSQLGSSRYKDEIYEHIREHVGQDPKTPIGCRWEGCTSTSVFQNVGGHTAQHIFPDPIRDAKRARLG